jgi:hypothetical protein
MTASEPQRYRIVSIDTDNLTAPARNQAISILTTEISDWINNGWLPAGGPSFSVAGDTFICAQAIYRPTP